MFLACQWVAHEIFWLNLSWSVWIGTALWVISVTQTAQMFLVNVPEVTGLITVNWFWRPTRQEPLRGMTVYPTGVWFKFPFEQVKLGNYINMRIVDVPVNENFPAEDGVPLHLNGTLLYRPLLDLLPRYIAVDDEVIDGGLQEVADGRLSVYVAEDPVKRARNSIDDYQKWVIEDLEAEGSVVLAKSIEVDASGVTGDASIEWLLGIDLLIVRLGDATYDPVYQKGLTEGARAVLVQGVADKMIGSGMNPKEAWNNAMIQFGLTQKQIYELEGLPLDRLAEAVAKVWRGGKG